MAEQIEWTSGSYDYRAYPEGSVSGSVAGTGNFGSLGQDAALCAVVAELKRRGEEIERLEFDLGRFKRMTGSQEKTIRELHRRPQIDGKAIAAAIVEALLPGVKLTGTDLVNLAEIHGTAIGQAMKRDTTP